MGTSASKKCRLQNEETRTAQQGIILHSLAYKQTGCFNINIYYLTPFQIVYGLSRGSFNRRRRAACVPHD